MNSDISLEILTKKSAVLLALSTGQRIQTLSLIKIQDISIRPDKIEIKIASRIKTSALNKPQPFLILPFLNADPQVCAARALLSYLERTEELRNSAETLFISYKKPHRQATPQTISRGVKNILEASGLDTNNQFNSRFHNR